MSARKVIVIKEGGGPLYTRPGENEKLILNKAAAFKMTWEAFKEEGHVEGLNEPVGLTDNTAWTEILKLYNDKDKVSWATKIDEYAILLECSESELRDFLVDELFDSGRRKVRKESYISQVCSDIRGMFRLIGREHAFGSGKALTHLGESLVNTGNPMTTATESFLKAELKKRQAAAKKAAEDAGIPAAAEDPEKLGGVVSVGVGYMVMMRWILNMMEHLIKWETKRIKQVSRIVNRAMLCLMYIFLMHEGARHTNIQKELKHEHLFFPCHTEVYWLVLVFLQPSTLAFLFNNNKFTSYVYGMFKGKDKQFVLNRIKAVMPVAYNTLDLVWVYTVCMRVMVSVAPTQLTTFVFKKSLNMTSLRHRLNKSLNFTWLTFYSFRYAGAVEDKKAGIDGAWTRGRMGHSVTSNTKDDYAADNLRVEYDGESIALGMEKYTAPTNSKSIQLEYITTDQTGYTLIPTWLDDVFSTESSNTRDEGENVEDYRKDFEDVCELVNCFLKKPAAESKEAFEKLMQRFDGFKDGWYTSMPMGIHFKIPTDIITEKIDEEHQSHIEKLKNIFSEVPDVDKEPMPVLWSFPQIFYGNWRGLIGSTNITTADIEPTPVPAGGSRASGSSSRALRDNHSQPDAQADAAQDTIHSPPNSDDETFEDCGCESEGDEPEGDEPDQSEYDFQDIEEDDRVTIYCTMPRDPCALLVPSKDGPENSKHVWIAKAKSVKVHANRNYASFKGMFYYNSTKCVDQDLSIRGCEETITISCESIIHIFAPDDDFHLTREDVDIIESKLGVTRRDS